MIKMSYTITVSGSDSSFSTFLNPPLHLDLNGLYEIALLNFETFYSIPNVDESNNLFHYVRDGKDERIVIPHGTYELDDISSFLRTSLEVGDEFILRPNNNTMKSELQCPYAIDFSREKSIGPLLGFTGKSTVQPNVLTESDELVNIFKVSIIRIECSLATGSFIGGKRGHSLYEFFPSVPPGHHISQEPSNPIYLPIIDTNLIDHLDIRVVDQNGDTLDFRNETITVRLHIRRNGNKF